VYIEQYILTETNSARQLSVDRLRSIVRVIEYSPDARGLIPGHPRGTKGRTSDQSGGDRWRG